MGNDHKCTSVLIKMIWHLPAFLLSINRRVFFKIYFFPARLGSTEMWANFIMGKIWWNMYSLHATALAVSMVTVPKLPSAYAYSLMNVWVRDGRCWELRCSFLTSDNHCFPGIIRAAIWGWWHATQVEHELKLSQLTLLSFHIHEA